MNLYTKQKQTHRYRKQAYGYQRGKGGRERDKLEVGINRHKLHKILYIKQISKDLLYSIGSYIQYLAITNNGK